MSVDFFPNMNQGHFESLSWSLQVSGLLLATLSVLSQSNIKVSPAATNEDNVTTVKHASPQDKVQ